MWVYLKRNPPMISFLLRVLLAQMAHSFIGHLHLRRICSRPLVMETASLAESPPILRPWSGDRLLTHAPSPTDPVSTLISPGYRQVLKRFQLEFFYYMQIRLQIRIEFSTLALSFGVPPSMVISGCRREATLRSKHKRDQAPCPSPMSGGGRGWGSP